MQQYIYSNSQNNVKDSKKIEGLFGILPFVKQVLPSGIVVCSCGCHSVPCWSVVNAVTV